MTDVWHKVFSKGDLLVRGMFGASNDRISLHLKNIYEEDELQEEATNEDFSVVQKEGNREVRRPGCRHLSRLLRQFKPPFSDV